MWTSLALIVIPPQKVSLVRYVIWCMYVDLYKADETQASPLPAVVPNTLPNEPSIAPEIPGELVPNEPPPRKLVRRAPSRAGSRAPSEPPVEEGPPAQENIVRAVQDEVVKTDPPKPTRRVCLLALDFVLIVDHYIREL